VKALQTEEEKTRATEEERVGEAFSSFFLPGRGGQGKGNGLK
jgi:hypothetical protein